MYIRVYIYGYKIPSDIILYIYILRELYIHTYINIYIYIYIDRESETLVSTAIGNEAMFFLVSFKLLLARVSLLS